MNKRQRLLLAATVTAAMLGQTTTSQAAIQTARDFLSDFASQISVGQYNAAQQRLAEIGQVCPGFEGLLLGSGDVISVGTLGGVLAAIESGGATPDDVVLALNEVLDTGNSINFLCSDVEVGALDLATASSFPVGSAG